ncbi:MAG: amidohydrolase family protein [Planctomycetota bacterium]
MSTQIRFQRGRFGALARSAQALAAVALVLTAQAPAFAQDAEDDAAAAVTDEKDVKWFALTGGDVYTGTGAVLHGATVLCKDKKISAIGYDLDIPDGAEVMDVSGNRVYPGLIASASFGLFGGGGELADSVDPYNRNMILALAAGVTTAVNGSQVAKLKRGEIEGVVIKDGAFESFNYSKSSPSSKAQLREKLETAAAYLRDYRQWENDVRSNKDLKEPAKKGVDQKVLDVLQGRLLPTFNADERTDLLEIARLAQRFGFRPIIRGCREGWVVADELGRAGAMAVITPRERRTRSEDLVREGGSSIENAAILYKHGVQVSVIPQSPGISLGGIVGRDLLHYSTEAAYAIRGGLPDDAALAALTIVPARMLGVDWRVGTLEPGKDADMIVTDGDLMHYQTWVQWAIVDGKVAYDKQEEMYFAHIRPRPEAALAPEVRVDPGEENPAEPPAPAEEAEKPAEQPEGGGGQ